jgi:nitrite reductase/ring-hydroxylating ferredoxin subunit
MAFRRVAKMSEIPGGRGLCVRVEGIAVGLYRVDGKVYAMENQCPHNDHPLHEGTLTDHVIVCPAHGWDFDVRTGFKPGDPDGFPIPCFAVRVESDEVSIDIEDVINRRRRS